MAVLATPKILSTLFPFCESMVTGKSSRTSSRMIDELFGAILRNLREQGIVMTFVMLRSC